MKMAHCEPADEFYPRSRVSSRSNLWVARLRVAVILGLWTVEVLGVVVISRGQVPPICERLYNPGFQFFATNDTVLFVWCERVFLRCPKKIDQVSVIICFVHSTYFCGQRRRKFSSRMLRTMHAESERHHSSLQIVSYKTVLFYHRFQKQRIGHRVLLWEFDSTRFANSGGQKQYTVVFRILFRLFLVIDRCLIA